MAYRTTNAEKNSNLYTQAKRYFLNALGALALPVVFSLSGNAAAAEQSTKPSSTVESKAQQAQIPSPESFRQKYPGSWRNYKGEDRYAARALAYWDEGKLTKAMEIAKDGADRELEKAILYHRIQERIDSLEEGIPNDTSVERLAYAANRYADISGGNIPGELRQAMNEKLQKNLEALAASSDKANRGLAQRCGELIFGFSHQRQAQNTQYKIDQIEDTLSAQSRQGVEKYRQQAQAVNSAKKAGADVSDIKLDGASAFGREYADPKTKELLEAAQKKNDEAAVRAVASNLERLKKQIAELEERRKALMDKYDAAAAEGDLRESRDSAAGAAEASRGKQAKYSKMDALIATKSVYGKELEQTTEELYGAESKKKAAEIGIVQQDGKQLVADNQPGAKEYAQPSRQRDNARKKGMSVFVDASYDPNLAGREDVEKARKSIVSDYLVPLGKSSEELVAGNLGLKGKALEDRIAALKAVQNPKERLNASDELLQEMERVDQYEPFTRRYEAESASVHQIRRQSLEELGKQYTTLGEQKMATAEEVLKQCTTTERFYDPQQSRGLKLLDELAATRSKPLPSLLSAWVNFAFDKHSDGYWHRANLSALAQEYNQFASQMKIAARDMNDKVYTHLLRDAQGNLGAVVFTNRPSVVDGNEVFLIDSNEAYRGNSQAPAFMMPKNEALELMTRLQTIDPKFRKHTFDVGKDGTADVWSVGKVSVDAEGKEIVTKPFNKDVAVAIGMTLFTQYKNWVLLQQFGKSGNDKKGGGEDDSSSSADGSGAGGGGGGGGPAAPAPVVPPGPVPPPIIFPGP